MLVILVFAALVAGGIASVAGFGIGSVLTPVLVTAAPAKVAVAAVSIPHFIATAFRLWLIREHIDLRLLRSFGLMSAIGGLTGAVANYFFASRALELLLAVLLLFVGFGGLTGHTKRLRFEGVWSWIAGGVSGFLGGLVGNQGGLRAGAMTGLGVSRDAFVATATTIGLIVDAARMPVYFVGQWRSLAPLWPLILAMSLAVIAGTLAGMAVLRRISQPRFMQVVSVLLIALAVWLAIKPADIH